MLGITSPSCAVPKEATLEKDELEEFGDRLGAIADRIKEITRYWEWEISYWESYLDNELKHGIHLELRGDNEERANRRTTSNARHSRLL